MAKLGPQIADTVLASCQVGAAAASEAVNRCLGLEVQLEPYERFETLLNGELPPELTGDGIVVRLEFDDGIALILMPAQAGLTADWLATPDETGHAKLAELSREVAAALLPDDLSPDKTSASYAADVRSVAKALQLDPQGCFIRFTASGDATCVGDALWLVWPAKGWNGQQVASGPQAAVAPPPVRKLEFADLDDGIRKLPSYARHLLKIPMSATVTLASTKMSVSNIEELGPGSIIQFRKSCDDTLTLEVGGREIAEGEAVKVGDKFGFWITSIIMPGERFEAIHKAN